MRDLQATRVELCQEEGVGYYESTRVGDELFTVARNASYRHPRCGTVLGDALIRFIFHLSGDRTLGASQGESVRVQRPVLLVCHQPAGVQLEEWAAPTPRECGVAISVRPQYLLEQFLISSAHPLPQLRSLVQSTANQFQFVQLPLTTQMLELAGQLVKNPYSEMALRLLHTEALTLQLLCAAVQKFSSLPDEPQRQYSDRNLRCLHEARRFLLRQLSPVPTIRQVARAAGINETSLKQGFKAVFGETLYSYSVRCRMERALRLLQEECMPVSKIANAVGYAHQTSFATAFRSHFGISPRDVRSPGPR